MGAYRDNESGSAYVFTRSGGVWTQQAKLTAFGWGGMGLFWLQRCAEWAIPPWWGAQKDEDKGSDSGSAYVFTRSGGVWTQQAKLTSFGWNGR